jgi:hypothetical protein
MKYLEWKSGSFDEENFQIVTSRKNKKQKEEYRNRKKEQPGGKE